MWDESRAKKTVKQSRAAAETGGGSNTNNNSSVTGLSTRPSTPMFQNNGSDNRGSYSSVGGDSRYQNSYDSPGSSYQNGATYTTATNLSFSDKKKLENSVRPADLSNSGFHIMENENSPNE